MAAFEVAAFEHVSGIQGSASCKHTRHMQCQQNPPGATEHVAFACPQLQLLQQPKNLQHLGEFLQPDR